MKTFRCLLLVFIIILNFLFARPSLADAPKITKTPEYIQISKSLDGLLEQLETAKLGEPLPEGKTVADIERKIDELSFEKYALEKGTNWSQCRNETGKTIGIYGQKSEGTKSKFDNVLYFLGAGETTPNGWDCQGIYVAKDSKITSADTELSNLSGAAALKIPKGTQLIAKTNLESGNLELNIVPDKIFKAGEINWYIPNVSQTNVSTRVSDVPLNKEDKD